MKTRARALGVFLVLVTCVGCGAQLAWYGHTRDRRARIEVRSDGEQQWVVIGERQSARYRAVALSSITTAPDGRVLTFVGMRRDGSDRERWYVVIDFVESRAWDGVGAVVIAPRGDHVAYLAEDNGRWRAVVDGDEHATFDNIDAPSLQFSPDASRVGYIAFEGTCARTVTNGVSGPCHATLSQLALGSDEAHDVLVATETDDPAKVRVLVGGNLQGEAVDEVRDVLLSPDGQGATFTARVGSEWFVVSAGVPGPAFVEVEAPVYSPDARRLGYLGRDARGTHLIVNGLLYKTVPAATALSLSPDGRRVAYVGPATRGSVIVVDDTPFAFDVVIEGALRWSRDGRHWAALVGALSERSLWIVVDGEERLPFDSEELFGGGLGDRDTIEALGEWVYAELERHLQRSRG